MQGLWSRPGPAAQRLIFYDRFFTYSPPTLAQGLGVTKLLPDMRPSTSNHLTASSRVFIAEFRRF